MESTHRRLASRSSSVGFVAAILLLGAGGCGGGSGGGSTSPDVPDVPSDLALVTTSLPEAESDVTWVASLEATGGAAPYVFSVTGAPSWLRFDAGSGLVWGTPPPAYTGTTELGVAVVDAMSAVASGTLALTVQPRGGELPPVVLPALADASDGHFRTSPICATCHSNASTASAMRDAAAREVGPVNLWRPSLMANAVRDPYFRAVLAAEGARHPGLAAAIEDTCLTCHAPAAAYEAHQAGGSLALSQLFDATARAQTGMDGVSCTLCHQIEPDGLGTPASFSAGFVVAASKVGYARHVGPFSSPMVGNSGFAPVQATHTAGSALCASCHTLYTETHTPAGEPMDARFPEQTPYLEWRNSVFNDEVASPGPDAASCASCHMPARDVDGVSIVTRIARNPAGNDFPPISDRSPYARHGMAGGNREVLRILRDQAQDLAPPASTAAFDELLEGTQALLGRSTATLRVSDVRLDGGRLEFDVAISNLSGHKFPTSYPSRRAWLRVRVKDAAGRVVWRSGEVDAKGRLLDGGGSPLASEAAGGPIEPHRTAIDAEDQVQVYESMLGNVNGEPDAGILHAASYLKDNRLLPKGWSDAHPDAEGIRPVGVAGDADFVGGGDTVRYAAVGLGAGPYRVEAELLFQSISARDFHELIRFDDLAPVNAFRRYFEASPHDPAVVAGDAVSTP